MQHISLYTAVNLLGNALFFMIKFFMIRPSRGAFFKMLTLTAGVTSSSPATMKATDGPSLRKGYQYTAPHYIIHSATNLFCFIFPRMKRSFEFLILTSRHGLPELWIQNALNPGEGRREGRGREGGKTRGIVGQRSSSIVTGMRARARRNFDREEDGHLCYREASSKNSAERETMHRRVRFCVGNVHRPS